ncbi:sensor domain-containing protein [Mycolicibacterium sp. P1-5]|nr:sensor domain-containing protein [Mycolicibacterium sp. P1-5]
MDGRRLAATAVVGCALVSAGCGGTTGGVAVTPTAPKLIARPLVERELPGLLLNVDQVNAAMGVNNMAVTHTATAMDDNAGFMAPPECLAIDGAAETLVYADSGYLAERDQSLSDGDKLDHYVKQAVVLYPTADQANSFFTASTQQWQACHEYTHTQSGTRWSVGQITVTDNTLSTTATEEEAKAPGRACGRALEHRNNIVIDVNTCAAVPGDSASKIADQIAGNVAAKW